MYIQYLHVWLTLLWTCMLILQIPSKLLIQVPRFGREFKTYQKTIPGLTLKLRGLVSSKTAGKVHHTCITKFYLI